MIKASKTERPLAHAHRHEGGVVSSLTADADTRRVLLGMGLVPGAHVEVLRAARKGPLAVRVGDARIALDHSLAEKILIA